MDNDDYVVKIEDVSFRYAGATAPALKDVSLAVRRGEIMLLIGPTGAGKSTLYMCLNGLIPHAVRGRMTGRVVVCGRETATTSVPELAQRIGFVFQDPDQQLFSLSVEDELAFGPENLGLPRAEIAHRIDNAQRAVRLGDILDREPARLSGGQKQSVAIGSVLAMLPDVLVMDEPTSSLDPENTQKVLQLIQELNEGLGKTILIAEHKIDAVAPLADRVVVLHEGSMLLEGEPENVLTNVASLHRAGITAPTATEFCYALKKRGLDVGKLPTSIDELLDRLDNLVPTNGRSG